MLTHVPVVAVLVRSSFMHSQFSGFKSLGGIIDGGAVVVVLILSLSQRKPNAHTHVVVVLVVQWLWC